MSLAALHRARTKIVATAGPACIAPDDSPGTKGKPTVLRQLIDAGADVIRINMAHGTRDDHDRVVRQVRQVAEELGRPIGILVDLAGPKIRLGEFAGDAECPTGGRVSIVAGERRAPDELPTSYPAMLHEVSPGDRVLLADGAVSLRVVERRDDRVICEVTSGGVVRQKQGINLPGVKLGVGSLTDADLAAAHWAAARGVDFVSLSFVRSADDMEQLRELLHSAGSAALTVAKIEKREALDHILSIAAVSDVVMVARGDLGVEIDVAETPAAQKRIVRVCQQLKKPVIVATQMLDSMHHSRRPTRAEATDVANAVLDGADACMLSGETAVGEYPVDAVRVMNEIMEATEQLLADPTWVHVPPPSPDVEVHPVTSAVVLGAGAIAQHLGAQLVVIATRTGATARVRAKQRDLIPTIGISSCESTLRQMCLYWGIIPVLGPAESGPQLREFVNQWTREHGLARDGDRIVYVTGSGIVPLAHNLIAVHEVSG